MVYIYIYIDRKGKARGEKEQEGGRRKYITRKRASLTKKADGRGSAPGLI